MKNEDELKQEIFEFVDQIHRYSREDMRKAILDFTVGVLNDRTAPVSLTLTDLNNIRDMTIREIQGLPYPAYVQRQVLDMPQRNTYCHLSALINFLRKRNLINYLIEIDTNEPFFYSIHEE
jgi:hypothetical protein